MNKQLDLFSDFEDIFNEEMKTETQYYIDKEDLEKKFVFGYHYHLGFTKIFSDFTHRLDYHIALLDDNKRVFHNHFIYEFRTPREAKEYFSEEISKMKTSYKEMIENPSKYTDVDFDTNATVRSHVYLVPGDGIKGLAGTTIYGPNWYTAIRGYFGMLRLPYDDKLDRSGKILWQLDSINDVKRLIVRDLKEGHTNYPNFYKNVKEYINRYDILVNELDYQSKEFLESSLDLEQLNHFLTQEPKKRDLSSQIVDAAEQNSGLNAKSKKKEKQKEVDK